MQITTITILTNWKSLLPPPPHPTYYLIFLNKTLHQMCSKALLPANNKTITSTIKKWRSHIKTSNKASSPSSKDTYLPLTSEKKALYCKIITRNNSKKSSLESSKVISPFSSNRIWTSNRISVKSTNWYKTTYSSNRINLNKSKVWPIKMITKSDLIKRNPSCTIR